MIVRSYGPYKKIKFINKEKSPHHTTSVNKEKYNVSIVYKKKGGK